MLGEVERTPTTMQDTLTRLLRKTRILGPMHRARSRLLPLATPLVRAYLHAYARRRGVVWSETDAYISVRRGRDEIRISRAHAMYCRDMIGYFDYYMSAVIPDEVPGGRLVDYSTPRLHTLSRSMTAFEFPALPESDESTDVYIDALRLVEGDTVLDLGAYAGASAYFLAKAVGPTGLVASFEPDVRNIGYLRANIARHNLTNVKVFAQGIWSETTTLSFQAEGSMGSALSSITGRESNASRIEVVSLAEAAALAGMDRVAAIKMDIEGAELAVLRSAGDFLRKHRPRLIIEPHRVDGLMNTTDVSDTLRAFDYDVHVALQGVQDWPLVVARPR